VEKIEAAKPNRADKPAKSVSALWLLRDRIGLPDENRREPVARKNDRAGKTWVFASRFGVFASIALVSACASVRDTYYPPQQPGAEYDTLYPQYLQLCAVSRIRAKFAKEGGSPGHAVMYLKGACKDNSYPYPRIKACDEGSAQTGVGISVNKTFKNVNWMAAPGKALFFTAI